VRDRRVEERVDRSSVGGVERDVRGGGHGLPPADREIVEPVRPIGDAVLLDVQLLVPERCERGRVQTPAGIQIRHHEQHVVHHDPPDRHGDTIRSRTPVVESGGRRSS